ncbi:hypothetical protein M378DRAFT_21839 [Amanita muscaria Koide BX008]|uniref:Sacsin/Nov domain-containing protein n=1 Tax=Amanita muscaria (strain Koide BX008) TaxID=946122 RepID=A0A0C2TP13_AMAMK|nr:hypothetical protein M378DRAFT_21839 [Amanita muscaria Koide BX008]
MARNELWANGFDESVEVNQRALINKILARYSGEFTVFRELLQNSDDAGSDAVEIHFETDDVSKTESLGGNSEETVELPDLKTTNVCRWIFKNNGRVFQEGDWNRLKKIAEGNPDEDKIGAFGVGFYSVFSITDTPFVTSGSQWMGFYWKDNKDQLFARRGNLPSETSSHWTAFELILREPSPMPPAFDLTRFLSSSIVFMTRLSEVSIYFNNKRLTKLTKATGIPKSLGTPAGLQTISPRRLMEVKGVGLVSIQITAEVMQWVYSTWKEKPQLAAEPMASAGGFFSSFFSALSKRTVTDLPVKPPPELSDPLTVNLTNLTLSIFSADVDVRLDQKLAKALHRSTLKDPPHKLKYQLIYTSKDEYDNAAKEDGKYASKTMSVFHGLRADLEGLGRARIYIGHATAQTTGLAGHMAARFIPTVERESIDLMDPNVAVWNRELLFIGGVLARSAYEHEIRNIDEIWRSLGEGKLEGHDDTSVWLQHRGSHALKFFTFHKSAPLEEVSAAFENSFFSCGPRNFPIVSTLGVRNAYDVRHPDTAMSGFIKRIPILPADTVKDAHRIASTLRSREIIKDMSFEDAIRELRARPLGEEEMLNCLQWWINLAKVHIKSDEAIQRLLRDLVDAGVLTYGENHAKLILLSKIRTFVNPSGLSSQIPCDGPLPDHLFPVALSKKFAPGDLSKYLLWTELTILEWIQYICDPSVVASSEHDFSIDNSPRWAERVLHVLSRAWPNLPAATREGITTSLAERTCIPTSQGMKKPTSAYFASADIFHDLPVISLPSGSLKGPMERLLEAIGVQKHVDLQMVFNRMVRTKEWTTADLIGYLVSIRSTLTPEEMARLKATAAFFKEDPEPKSTNAKVQRFQARQLYEPLDAFRQMQIPIIDWNKDKKWRGSSKEATFLFELGLRRHPPLNELVLICASNVSEIQQSALKYLLDNIDKAYKEFAASNYYHVAFIPAMKGSDFCLGSPKDVFVESEWAAMSFLVLDPIYRQDAMRLGVSLRPSVQQLVAFLENNRPRDKAEARVWFELLAGRINELTQIDRAKLSRIHMVPHEVQNSMTWLPPAQCYLSVEDKTKHFSKLFVFVDFGVTASSFLSVCGAKRRPDVNEIAQKLLEDPVRFHEITGGYENFLAELRQISVNFHELSNTTLEGMRRTSCLVASQRKLRKSQRREGDINEFEDSDWEITNYFKKPNEIVIADDTQSLRVFGESLFMAPQEDLLEELYHRLGAQRLSLLVKEDYHHGAELETATLTNKIRSLILERLPLFLHERSASQLKLSFYSLSSDKSFVVKTFRGLYITKSLVLGSLRLSQKQDASAVAFRVPNGTACLWLSNIADLDMYEIAIGLTRLMLEKPNANDALLLTTILSTDLALLKKRGFNVERILKRRAAEHVTRIETIPDSPKPSNTEKTTTFGALNKILRPAPDSKPVNARKTGISGNEPPIERIPPSTEPHKVPSAAPLSRTNVTNLGKTIEKAIQACHSESDSKFAVLQSVRETLERNFHDTCGAVNTLSFIGEEARIKVFLAEEVPHPHLFLNAKRHVLKRFSTVVAVLGSLFGLPTTSLHIFFDLSSQHIAFNREGSLFFNLRFYEAWHDADMESGNKIDVYAFWYFTFAHEIAHNLVQDHNAEHEFYFSATSQKYIPKLFKLF